MPSVNFGGDLDMETPRGEHWQLHQGRRQLRRRDRHSLDLARKVRIVQDERATAENPPSHRGYVGRAEIGAAWSRRSGEGRACFGLKLDDPSFTGPIYANLFDDDEGGEGYSLISSRPTDRRD